MYALGGCQSIPFHSMACTLHSIFRIWHIVENINCFQTIYSTLYTLPQVQGHRNCQVFFDPRWNSYVLVSTRRMRTSHIKFTEYPVNSRQLLSTYANGEKMNRTMKINLCCCLLQFNLLRHVNNRCSRSGETIKNIFAAFIAIIAVTTLTFSVLPLPLLLLLPLLLFFAKHHSQSSTQIQICVAQYSLGLALLTAHCILAFSLLDLCSKNKNLLCAHFYGRESIKKTSREMAKKGGSETSDPPAGPSPSLNHPGSGTLTTDASTAGRTTFFSLPAELRVQIYRHAFVPDHIIELTPKETRWEDYPPLARIRPHAINPIVSALLVSKRFAREASAEFYRHAIFHLGVHWHVNHHEFARRVNRNCLRSGGNANTLVHLARLKDLERIERLILTVYSEMTRVQAPNSYDFQMVADGKPVPLPAPPACHTYGATEEEQRTELRREEYEDPVERTLGRRTDFEPLLLPVSLHDFEPHEQSKREWDRLCQLLFRGGPLTTRDATWYGKKNHLNLGGGLCGVLELKVMVRITAFAKHVNGGFGFSSFFHSGSISVTFTINLSLMLQRFNP